MDKKEIPVNTNLENVKEGKMKTRDIGSTRPTTIGYGLMMRNGDRRFIPADTHKEVL